MANSDSSMAWIMADGIETRTLVEKSQGHVIRISIRNTEMFSQGQVEHQEKIDVVLYTGGWQASAFPLLPRTGIQALAPVSTNATVAGACVLFRQACRAATCTTVSPGVRRTSAPSSSSSHTSPSSTTP